MIRVIDETIIIIINQILQSGLRLRLSILRSWVLLAEDKK